MAESAPCGCWLDTVDRSPADDWLVAGLLAVLVAPVDWRAVVPEVLVLRMLLGLSW
jgi:hypothetical protein